ncbi:MAG: Alkaline phosphatase [Candidatus Solibacter sp.]|nr:Alkaline phosphatase [Candidatus Solibacter sp.]
MKRNRFLSLATAAITLAIAAKGQSVPSFVPPVGFPAPGASAAASGDFNGDGRVDIVTANGIATGSHGVSLILSNGDGTFQGPRNFSTGTDPSAIAVGDFNGDGKLDVAVSNGAANSLSILLGNGDGTLQAATTVGLPGLPFSIFAADFNSDGKKDLIVVLSTPAGYQDAILLSNGDGTFSVSTFAAAYGLVVADFNGDGKEDLALYGYPTGPGAAIKFGVGDGTFLDSQLPFTSALPFQVTQAVAGDFNGDGKMDLYGEFVSTGGTRAGYIFSVYIAIGNGDGTFSVNTNGLISNGIGGQNLLVGDFNHDGKLDVAGILTGVATVLVRPQANTLRISYGQGNGSFPTRGSFSAGDSTALFTSTPLVSGDFDGNGAPDFAWVTGTGINVIRNANGVPPLLSKLSVDSGYVVGGSSTVLGTVTIGDPAPAGGAVIALTSSDPAAAFFPGGASVTIPSGSASATFTIATGAVAAVELVTVTASWNGVNQTASFDLVAPFTITSITYQPTSFFGWFGGGDSTFATVTFSGPVSDGVVLSVMSSNPGLVRVSPVYANPGTFVQGNPMSLSIPPGGTTAFFQAIALTNVAADTPVTVSATVTAFGTAQGAPNNSTLTVLKASDTVKITKAEWVAKTGVWTIEGTSSNPSASIRVLTTTGQILGDFIRTTNGKYKGQGFAVAPFTSVALQSNFGGFTTGPVTQK